VGDKWFIQTFAYFPVIERIHIYSVDDTVRRKAELALEASETRYRRLFETAQDGILILDAETGLIMDVNPFLTDMLGYSHETFLGKKLWEIGPFKDIEASRDRFSKLQKKGYVRYEDLPIETLDGRHIQVEFVSNVYRVDHKKVIQCNIRDITERKKAEAVLKRDKVSFEKMVEERTAELLEAESELEKAKRLSDIGTLAATVAHELRNPLATIKIAVYNIRKKMSDKRVEQHLTNIEGMIEESSQIINNLLFYSRIRMPECKNINLHDILRECILSAEQQFKEQDISVIRKIETLKDFSFEADPMHMKEVFSNILNNAYDAIADRKGTIEIKGEICDGAFLKISFRDTGAGISPADIEKIMNPFFTTKSKGTGLGLSVCNQIINLYKGEINIESEKGIGTIVTVVLPIKNKNVKKNTGS
jgi:PAS domain S-box-containing protein